ncbi:Serine/threonine-protein kinase ULK3 [Bagarius yarrelli]|uniref:non-specific serine/threonine protein kinase n=1 Tax=Bagarius yarrelli TaxID=175774 RepID=A0A556TQL0_BAGYA|nr:Serine/threonine-protein kinase ULK3 [Bagarius yarrelli]
MASSFAPPRIADFVLTEKLGSGTYAMTDSREAVAVKVVSKKSLNKSSMENLLTEIEILKTVRHPHIVQLKDFQWDSENIYLILEWCSGGDLSRFIRSRRILPERVARLFLQQMACALKFLHEKNISHLDLKPQNILLSGTVLKLADFGFAQYMSPWDEKSSLRGSPLYMAPEIVCQRQYDARVDLWSVGVILYEALFGRAPFASRSCAELEEKIRSDKPIELPAGARVSRDCRDLLLRLLERDPDLRISFDEFFLHPFVDLEHMASAESLDKAVRKCEMHYGYCTSNLLYGTGGEWGRGLRNTGYISAELGEMLLVLAAEPQGRRRELLHNEVLLYVFRERVDLLKMSAACQSESDTRTKAVLTQYTVFLPEEMNVP